MEVGSKLYLSNWTYNPPLHFDLWFWMVWYLLVLIFLDDLIYGNLQSNIVVAGMTAILIDPKLCSGHRLSIWDLSQIKTELLVVSSLVRKIFIFLH